MSDSRGRIKLELNKETCVATYTILYTYKVLIVGRKHFSYVASVNFLNFRVCRIHVTLDNLLFGVQQLFRLPHMFASLRHFYWESRNVVTVFSLSSIIKNIHLFGNLFFLFHSLQLHEV